jgi:hypothetical protein
MAEFKVGQGDALSQLIQTIARENNIKDLRWTGQARVDIKMLLIEMYNARLIKEYLWQAMTELCGMPEMKDLPEALQAKIMAIILTARAKIDQEQKA